jgi:hypothetical protein
MKKVLATSWHPGGINAIIPVIKRISQEGKADIVTIGHQYSESILTNSRVSHNTIKAYGLNDVSQQSMEHILQTEKPDIILMGTSAQDENNRDIIEHTLTLAGRKHGIPTIAVVDFWSNYSARFSDIYTGEKLRFMPDIVAVMDKYAKDDMILDGVPERHIVITGNPNFDNLESIARAFSVVDRMDIRRKISPDGSWDDAILFFYAANAWKKDTAEYGYWDMDNIRIIGDAINSLPGPVAEKSKAVIKLHPRVPKEDLEEISEYVSGQAAGSLKLISDVHPYPLILSSDLTLTPFSTTAIEAVYMRKPCISIQPGLKTLDRLAILTKNEVIPVGYDAERCKGLIQRAYADDGYRTEELPKKLSSFSNDGKATERVEALVYKTINVE